MEAFCAKEWRAAPD